MGVPQNPYHEVVQAYDSLVVATAAPSMAVDVAEEIVVG